MAKAKKNTEVKTIKQKVKKRTSIGASLRSRPKHKKANRKAYRGQGR